MIPGMDHKDMGRKGGARNSPAQQAQRSAPKPGAGRPVGAKDRRKRMTRLARIAKEL